MNARRFLPRNACRFCAVSYDNDEWINCAFQVEFDERVDIRHRMRLAWSFAKMISNRGWTVLVVLTLVCAGAKPAAAAAVMNQRGPGGCCAPCCAPCQPCVQYDVVHDVRHVQCYRTVYETAYRDCTWTVCKPVYETTYQDVPDVICRTVVDMVDRPYSCTVLKPVYRTVQQPRCRVVCKPVTKMHTYCVDQGCWQTPPNCDPCCPPCPVWVPKIVRKQVPVTCMVPQTITEMVSVQVCQLVPETVNRVARVPVCRVERQNIVRRVPHVQCRIVSQQVSRKVPYTVCRQVPYTVEVRVPRCVPRPCHPVGATASLPQHTDSDQHALRATGRRA